jgi:3-hydroxyisobutyrate dehydrogenase
MEKQEIKVGWIGTGVMGFSMCKHLISAGYSMMVYNRTMSKAQGLIDLGAVASDPVTIAKSVDFLFLILGHPKDVEEMTISEDKGILKHMKKGAYLIDHTTSSPSLAEKIHSEAKKYGVYSYDAPVTGGDIGARDGKLITLVGGDSESYSSLQVLLNKYSKIAELLGGPGIGQHTKAVNQIMIATKIIGVCEGLMYAYKAGLNVKKTFEILSQGASSSTQLTVYTPRMFKRDFEPGFYAEHFIKDMGIALEECKRMELQLKGLELAYSFYQIMKDEGLDRKGHHGILLVLEKMNNLKVEILEN